MAREPKISAYFTRLILQILTHLMLLRLAVKFPSALLMGELPAVV